MTSNEKEETIDEIETVINSVMFQLKMHGKRKDKYLKIKSIT
jgi:hypothetical protein